MADLCFVVPCFRYRCAGCEYIIEGTPIEQTQTVPTVEDYATAVAGLDIDAVLKDIIALLTTSDVCWPADSFSDSKIGQSYGGKFCELLSSLSALREKEMNLATGSRFFTFATLVPYMTQTEFDVDSKSAIKTKLGTRNLELQLPTETAGQDSQLDIPTRPKRTDIRTRHRILTQKTQTCTRGTTLRRERTPMVKFIFFGKPGMAKFIFFFELVIYWSTTNSG